VTCKALERFVLNTKPVKETVDELKVVTLQADWTKQDEEIGRVLDELGGRQIPTVVIYSPTDPDHPIIFRDGVTQTQLIAKLKEVARKNGRKSRGGSGQPIAEDAGNPESLSLRGDGDPGGDGPPAVVRRGPNDGYRKELPARLVPLVNACFRPGELGE